MDPGAHHVAELHPGLLEKLFGDTEHRQRPLVGIPSSVETPRVEPDLFADAYPQAVRTRALGASADGSGRERVDAQPRPRRERKDRLQRDLQGPLTERRLLDLGDGGPVMRRRARSKDAIARRADELEVRLQAAQEERLADDRSEAPSFGFEDGEGRAVDRLRLLARVRRAGERLAEQEDFAGRGTVQPTEDDPAALRLDRLRRAQGPSSAAMRGQHPSVGS
jgi:hypothetical protein